MRFYFVGIKITSKQSTIIESSNILIRKKLNKPEINSRNINPINPQTCNVTNLVENYYDNYF